MCRGEPNRSWCCKVADGPARPGRSGASRLGIYRRLLGAQARGQASYRASFALELLSTAIVPIIGLLAAIAMFQVTDSLGGFTAAEVMLMLGLSACSFAVAELVVGRIDRLSRYVRTGRLDACLIRPLSVLGQLLALDFSVRRIAQLAVAGAILGGAVARLDLALTPDRVALLLVYLGSGAIYFGALFVATAAVAFWWIDSGELASSLTYGGREFAEYPVTIYSGVFRRLFGFVLGSAFVAYYPALTLLDRADATSGWLAPTVALVASAVATFVWRIGIRRYRSTGS